MSAILKQSEQCGQLFQLSNEQLSNPYQVLEDFFSDLSIAELKPFLEEVLEVCLTSDHLAFSKPEQRADLLYKAKRVGKLIGAVGAVLVQRESSKTE